MIVDDYYYLNSWGGQWDGSEEHLNKLIDLAEQIVYIATFGKTDNIAEFPDQIQERIKKAICCQTDYIIANGGFDYFTSDNLETVSLGSFSYSTDNKGSTADLCSAALNYLQITGLLYRGVL